MLAHLHSSRQLFSRQNELGTELFHRREKGKAQL